MRTPTIDSFTTLDKIKKFLIAENITVESTASPKMLLAMAKRRIKRKEREAEAKDKIRWVHLGRLARAVGDRPQEAHRLLSREPAP